MFVEGDRTQSTALEALLQILGNFAGSAQPRKLAAAWKIEVMFRIGLHWGIAMHSQQSSLAERTEEQPWTPLYNVPLYDALVARTEMLH